MNIKMFIFLRKFVKAEKVLVKQNHKLLKYFLVNGWIEHSSARAKDINSQNVKILIGYFHNINDYYVLSMIGKQIYLQTRNKYIIGSIMYFIGSVIVPIVIALLIK